MNIYGKGRTFFIAGGAGLIAGLIAALLSTVLMGILRVFAGIPTPVELIGDFILKHINVDRFIQLLNMFAPHPKTGPLGVALAAMLLLGTLLGLLYAALVRVSLPSAQRRPGRREWLVSILFAVVMTLLGTGLFWNELRQNLLGFPINSARLLTIASLLVSFSVYALTLCLVYRLLLPARPQTKQQRRQVLNYLGVTALGVISGGAIALLLQDYLGKYASYDGFTTPLHGKRTAPITPNSEHYVVTKNTLDPTPDSALWRLEVAGLVRQPGTYTYAELQQLPAVSRAITLECISNPLAGHLMGTAIWQGVELKTLLEKHGGTLPGANFITMYSVDGYTISLPATEVIAVNPLLAWKMNAEPLPQRHGFPLRALIPGRYGEMNPKWLTRIEFTEQKIEGLYQSQGWYDGPLHTTSRIDFPTPETRLTFGQAVTFSGIAFAGNRGIQQVEVSTDGGQNWTRTSLQDLHSQDAWVLWSWRWQPDRRGKFSCVVRAVDGSGTVQSAQRRGAVPAGATGYHTVPVEVI
ncbi:hypothetical protein EPA93_02760 [Ktedonosporobacter rubrisoli]|uniref:Molybdopterin-binding oxidoreductase n=1 Tax=Ktedonosporobacter rubrisoli TaxID=2509675 RepID=A0A4P6JIS1_KTERU|nr:molybdopterin-dependent oxidoreductase [Ktedonosporobacter rubrisoli]QBD74969.1 hypothetical protein EPA93_02760 [Ktedonosporobacter rubrisoli]